VTFCRVLRLIPRLLPTRSYAAQPSHSRDIPHNPNLTWIVVRPLSSIRPSAFTLIKATHKKAKKNQGSPIYLLTTPSIALCPLIFLRRFFTCFVTRSRPFLVRGRSFRRFIFVYLFQANSEQSLFRSTFDTFLFVLFACNLLFSLREFRLFLFFSLTHSHAFFGFHVIFGLSLLTAVDLLMHFKAFYRRLFEPFLSFFSN
jgi:hypothetical protein